MSPTEIDFYANHNAALLREIVKRYTQSSAAMTATSPVLAYEAMQIANAAWGQLVLRGEKV